MVLPSLGEGVLNDISAGPSRIVWAVGKTTGSFSVGTEDAPLALRWSGRGWKEVRGPRRSGLATLLAVDAQESVWIGGGDYSSGVYNPTVLQRRTPRGWQTVPGARIAEGLIEAVGSSSTSNAWAVGYEGGAGSINSIDAVALHWNGRTWRRVPLPRERITNPDGEPVDSLSDVATVGADRAWAVGSDQAGGFALRWNGRAWSRTRMPSAPASLAAVASRGPQTLAVGGTGLFSWGGRAWLLEKVSSKNVAGSLYDVAILPGGQAWAVGGSSDYEGGPTRTLILRRSCS